MRITIVNYCEPQCGVHPDIRWWHKSGSRWPATISNRGNDGRDYFPYPFLLCYLKTLLDSRGHVTTLLDGCLSKWSPPEAIDAIRKTQPDYIIFETSEQTEVPDQSFLKKIERTAPVCLIGPNITEDRSDLFDWPGVHACVPGEYLLSSAAFFDNPHRRMASRQEVLGTAAMDALPFAFRDPRTFPRYSARFKTTPPGMQAQFVSMWGCQYRCKFCIWIHSFWPRSSQSNKQFSIPRLEAELDDLLARFPQTTSLYDDCDYHHLDESKAYQYAEMLGRKRLPWALLTRADTFMKNGEINRGLWRHYRDNGCYGVKIGIEGTQEAMDATNKRLSEQVVRDFVTLMKDFGISVYASFMLGIPGTSQNTELKTVQFAHELASDRSNLFEYFISSCSVTGTTPFAGEANLISTGSDGQADIERRIATENILISDSLGPLNITRSAND